MSFRPLSGYLISKLPGFAYYANYEESGFRPLSGYLISKSNIGMNFVNGLISLSFRPLSGYLISKWSNTVSENEYAKLVSVPSRGILFPNKIRYILEDSIGFPSPLGVSYFQMMKADFTFTQRRQVFPSPLGVSYFQILMSTNCEENKLFLVSVPSRGILFPNERFYIRSV